MGGFSAVGPHVHLMHGIAWIMAAIFAYVYFAPYRRMRGQVQAEDFAAAGAEMLRIRPLVGVNLGLGLLMVVVASGGKFWL
jgi:uncharacterized membrane protein